MASQRTFNRSYDDYKTVHFLSFQYVGHLSVKQYIKIKEPNQPMEVHIYNQ